MTLPVFDTGLITGVDGPAYKVGPRCANPGCTHYADEAHHLVRRSKIGGPFDWVDVIDVGVVANKAGLCWPCHNLITEDKAAIRYDHGLFVWCLVSAGVTPRNPYYQPIAPLFPQPPTPESLVEQTSGQETASENCPTCGQQRRRRTPPQTSGERRRRKTWTVSVPDDDEDGAGVLDVLIDDLAPLFGYHGDDLKAQARLRYFVLVPTLVFAQQNRHELVDSIEGVGA